MTRFPGLAHARSRRLAALAALALLVPALSACAGRGAEPVAGESVTNAYRMGGIRFDNERGDESIFFAVARLREENGMTAVCGAYGISGARDFAIFGIDRLPAVLDRVRVQFDGETFMWDAARFNGPHPVGEIKEIIGVSANCLRLDRPWQAEYADRDKLVVDMPNRMYFLD
ncbi:hypothetical protein [Albimonas pacifica]|uniref:Lipoprotein n=1 Tax=Albimonas pacifica TaxID=1114924 RepID=A0A1I3NTM8_9RHOB|nr:hypothetical protein [Albimonas pacifica]SFJ12645.1 hypothetical protein SAMN05216258_11472 [Albimonas pacifica]